MTAAPMVARFAQACAREGGAVEPVAGPFWGYEFVRNDGIVLIERREAERRIDTLRAQLEAAEADTSFATAAASIREWKARAEAAEADATRYVRLRSALYGDGLHVGEAVIQMDVIGQCPSTVDIDAAIDAAKAATP